ncbi:MAG: DNA methyltransferase, partial [Candidatus Omnitrophota bacterium]
MKNPFKEHIQRYERLGTYTSPENEKLDILIVHLTNESKLERARTAIRNFVADHLKTRDERDAALVAFVSPSEATWRFSYVKMEYAAAEKDSGEVGVEAQLTPARRFSYIVGEGESCHTAQTRFLDLLQDTETDPLLADIEEAFSVEAVTKEFFTKYAELYEEIHKALEELLVKDKTIRDEFTTRGVNAVDFAKKLMGQIVFLYFLQKKGWLGVPEDRRWGDGDKQFLSNLFGEAVGKGENFFNGYLEYLFYDALARQDRGTVDPAYYPRFNCKIPFLNGGLFDPINNYDWINTNIFLHNTLFSNTETTKDGDTGTGILDIFNRYNFTVKEDEPLDKEVAVDPEMLGKVFENLLDVKNRKSKGTYYTPREIVHYMCQESLINYLDTTVNTGETPLAKEKLVNLKLFGAPAVQQQALKTEGYTNRVPREDIETLVRVGELAIEHDTHLESQGKETPDYLYKLPPSIRFNAALIDDALATIMVCDPAIGSGAFLVGMMTEIVRARGSLTPFLPKDGRSNYTFKRDAIQSCLYGVDIDPGAVEIAKLRLWLSLVVDEEDIKQIQPLPNLDYKIVCGNSLIGVQRNMFNNALFEQLENKKSLFFEEYDPENKQFLKREIDQLIDEIKMGDSNFDFEVYFSEVFHEISESKRGFDILISNPPYVGNKGHKDEFQLIQKGNLGAFYERRMDLFYFFFHLALNLGTQNASLAFITTNYYATATGGKRLRLDLRKRSTIKNLINFNELKIFPSALGQHNMITILEKTETENTITSSCVTRRQGYAKPEILRQIFSGNDEQTNYYRIAQNDIYDGDEFYIRLTGLHGDSSINDLRSILNKMKANSTPLGRICNLDQGIVSGADKVTSAIISKYPQLNLSKGDGIFVLDNNEVRSLNLHEDEIKEFVKPFYKNSDIHKWIVRPKNELFILYLKDEGQKIILSDSLKRHFG